MEKILNFLNQKRVFSLILILIVTTVVYSNIFSNEFVWDDPDFYGNWPVLYNFKNIPDLLTGGLPPGHGGVYRPLRSVFQLFIFQLLGGEVKTLESGATKNLFGYHLISLLIHLAGVIAIYFLIELLTEKRILAFFTALIFGVHPIHTEAITYFTTSIDIIGAVFFLWAIYLYLKSQNKAGVKWLIYTFSVILAWLAFFTYEITLVLPLVIVLIDLYKQNFRVESLKEKIKFYPAYWIGIFVWLTLRLSLDIGVRAFSSTIETNLFTRLLTVSKAIMKYIYILFIPYPLNVYHKINFSWTLAEPKVFLSILAIVGLLIIAIVIAKKRKIISLSIFWFFLCLAPVSNVFPTAIVMAEKYTYLASVSACLILAWLIYQLIKTDKKILQIVSLLIILIVTTAYGSLTYARNFDWQNDEILWLKTLELRPDYGRVYNNLGFVYYRQKRFSEAINYLEQAMEKEPNLAVIYQNLGNIYDELGNYDQAITNYEKVIELKSNLTETYNNLGIIYQKIGNLEKAEEYYQKAIEVDPSYFISYSNLGVIYLIKQDWAKAQQYFQQALDLNQNFAQAHHGLAAALLNQQEIEKAIQHYEKSMALMPELIDNYNHLALIYDHQGDSQKAIQILEKGIAANPQSAELYTNLAIFLANKGKIEPAIQYLNTALQIDPGYQQALNTLNKIKSFKESQ